MAMRRSPRQLLAARRVVVPEEPDAMLVEACLSGDTDAFAVLVARYQRPLFNLALRITGNRDDALDATQSAFLRAFERLATFDPSRRFFSWIYKIACNEALRLATRMRPAELPPADPAAPGPAPDRMCEDHEVGREIARALGELSPEQRAVIVLRHHNGLTYDELADVLGIPVKTVRSRLFEARQRLRAVLSARGVTPW